MKKFALIANLRDKNDVLLVFPECNGGKLPPFKIWSEFDVFGKAHGYIIILGLTGAQVMSSVLNGDVRRQILQAIMYGQELGIEVFGLTSLTSSVTSKGRWLADREEVTAALTHGDTYAAGVALEGLDIVASKTGRSLEDLTVAIIGAYGLIGEAMSKVLSQRNISLVLVGRKEAKLERLLHNLPRPQIANIIPTCSLSDIKMADIIVTATSSPDALIKPEYVKDNGPVVIYEVSVPPNVPENAYIELQRKRPNVVKVDGSLVVIPGINLGVQITGIPDGVTFACWAETMMRCLEDDIADHVGEISVSYLEKTMLWGRKYGFLHAPLTCFGQPVPDYLFQLQPVGVS